jgi:2-oxoglutarate dehydrogenase E1 component
VEISTDKVDMELPAPAAGTLTEILAEEGETVTVGQVIARMQAGAGAAKVESNGGTAATAPERQRAKPKGHRERQRAMSRSRPSRRASPPPRASTSPACRAPVPTGRITKDDVLAAARNGGASAAAPANGAKGAAAKPAGAQLIKGGAATLARYMDESRSIPTATSFRTITVTTMDGRRKELKAAGQKVSFTHLIATRSRCAPSRTCRSWPTTSPRSTASRTASTTTPCTSASRSTWRRRTARAR